MVDQGDINRLREFVVDNTTEPCQAHLTETCNCMVCLVDHIMLDLMLHNQSEESRALEFARTRPFAWKVP